MRFEALVVTGVSGAGKTTIGQRLARELGATFLDADAFHPPENVAKMRSGVPLTDADRSGWLATLRAELQRHRAAGEPVVLACSALKEAYRRVLAEGSPNLRFVHLQLTPEVARARLEQRGNHFMPTSLVASQFAALEPPTDALVIDATQPVDAVVEQALTLLGPDASR